MRRQVALHNVVRLAVYQQPKATGSVWPCPAMRSKSKGKQRRKASVYLGSPSGLLQSIHLTPRLRFRLKCLLSLQSSCLLSFLFVLHLSAVCYFILPPQPPCLTAFKIKQSPSPSCQSSTLGKRQASVLFCRRVPRCPSELRQASSDSISGTLGIADVPSSLPRRPLLHPSFRIL